MSIRRVKIVLLCEDSQHEAFTRRFLEGMGWNMREMRVEKSPTARGSAEQWVKGRFPAELKVYRQRRQKAASGLIAMIDADAEEVQDRISEFEAACGAQQTPFRADGETVAIVVAKRNIETWIHYLNGRQVNEQNSYAKLERERGCKPAVNNLVHQCKSTGLTGETPPSLATACNEYRERISPLK
jgi:hypothetical protein